MATPIIMPKFGQMTEDSTILEWLKKEGDRVTKGETLFTVETDKSVMEVESFEEGTLLKIVVAPGVSVPVQSTVGFLGNPSEPIPVVAPPPPPAQSAVSSTKPAVAAPAAVTRTPMPVASVAPMIAAPIAVAPPMFRISPRAAALARRSVIDAARVKGTGPEGRIVEKDVKAYLEAAGYNRLRVTPAAKLLAAKEKLDLLAIAGRNDSGGIGVAEVERAVAEKPVVMSKMRQVIAERLTQSVNTAPHWYCTVSADMGAVNGLRAELKAKGVSYTVTDFIAEAVILSLKEFPAANSTTNGKTTRWSSRVHLGLAVALDAGLVVPVVFNADELTMAELSAKAKDLFAKARAGKLGPDEMSGSTFSISNLGMMNVEDFAAIINLGEAAILAVSSTIDTPVVRDGKIVIRPMMKMTVSSDHRLIDGSMAARFINAIKNKLEDVELWKSLT